MADEYKNITKLLKIGSDELEQKLKASVHVKTGALKASIDSSSFRDEKIRTSFLDYGRFSRNWNIPYGTISQDLIRKLVKDLEKAFKKDITEILKNYAKKYK